MEKRKPSIVVLRAQALELSRLRFKSKLYHVLLCDH